MTLERLLGHRLHFHASIVFMVLVIVFVMAIATLAITLSVADRSAIHDASQDFSLLSQTIRERTDALIQPALDAVSLLASIPEISEKPQEDGLDHKALPLFEALLRENLHFYSVYAGYSDGSFIQLIAPRENQSVLQAHGAPRDTQRILRSIETRGANRQEQWVFLGHNGALLGSRLHSKVNYDPRSRPWYLEARGKTMARLSDPYTFHTLNETGISASHAFSQGIAGIDLTADELVRFVSEHIPSPNGAVALYVGKHWPLALSPGAERFLGDWDKSVTQNSQNHRLATVMSQQNILRSYQWTPAPGKTLHLMVGAPLKDFLTEALLMRQRILITALMVLLITAPVAFFWGIRLARALQELTLDAERIGALDFTGNLKVNSPIYEYWRLEQAFDVMKGTIAERTKDLQESNQHLAMLVDMGIAMSTETDIDSLSTMILSNAKELTHADSGVLFLVNPEKTQLNFHIVLNDSLQGSSPQNTSFKPINLYDEQGNENRQQMAAYCYHSRESMAVDDVYDSPRFTLTGFQNFDAERGYKSQSALTVPLKTWGSGTPLGVLLLINATHPKTHKILPFPKDLISYVEALSAGAAGVLQNHNLLRQHKKLFDELAQFIGSAIGGKSPHTARHCARVPVVARIIADAAEAVTEGPLANFSFENDAQRREFEIAAWLHDCGKVTTPEYVIDKATKLETIGNRIHEIRTRFEVLHRDATIAYKDALLSGAPPDMAQKKLEQKKAALHEDFAFLAQCNLGDRPLREEEIQRIKSISHRVWTRHFDDSLGLSWQELERLNAVENQDHQKLPVLERLLADKPQHLIPRDDDAREEYAKLGFTFPIPEYLYNRGEIHNLSVRAGTLSPEERFKINEHIAQSILMLSQLDFPDDLKKVVELAGSHHETPDGKGYPRGLNNQDLSIPAKILAIADIFEALTSSDRPYKRDKTLSETFDILYDMKEAHKIDPHLFDMLVSSGAYMDYARGYLKPRQIDEVEAARYQNSTPPA